MKLEGDEASSFWEEDLDKGFCSFVRQDACAERMWGTRPQISSRAPLQSPLEYSLPLLLPSHNSATLFQLCFHLSLTRFPSSQCHTRLPQRPCKKHQPHKTQHPLPCLFLPSPLCGDAFHVTHLWVRTSNISDFVKERRFRVTKQQSISDV